MEKLLFAWMIRSLFLRFNSMQGFNSMQRCLAHRLVPFIRNNVTITPTVSHRNIWSKQKDLELFKMVQNYGTDLQIIKKNSAELSTVTDSILQIKLERFERNRSFGPWTVDEEIELIAQRMKGNKSFVISISKPQDNEIVRRTNQQKVQHYRNQTNPFLLHLKSQGIGETYEELYEAYLKILLRLREDKGNVYVFQHLKLAGKRKFTEEEDKKIMYFYRILGPSWSLISGELPGWDPERVMKRYHQIIRKSERPWTGSELQCLKKVSEIYRDDSWKATRIQKNYFPDRSLNSVKMQLKIFQEFSTSPLTTDELQTISKGVEEYGRPYFLTKAKTDLPNRTFKFLVEEWALLEPKEQKNAVWTSEIIDELETLSKKYSLSSEIRLNSKLLQHFKCKEITAGLNRLKAPKITAVVKTAVNSQTPLTINEFRTIKKGVEDFGRLYFLSKAKTDFPDRSYKFLIRAWIVLEPNDQKSKIWTPELLKELESLSKEYKTSLEIRNNSKYLKPYHIYEIDIALTYLIKKKPVLIDYVEWTPEEDAKLINISRNENGMPIKYLDILKKTNNSFWEKVSKQFDGEIRRSSHNCKSRYVKLTAPSSLSN